MLSSTKLGLTNPDATRIANEVSQWKLDTHYHPTPEDEIVLKSVALGTVRRTMFKIVGATAAAVGQSSKSKVPMTVSIAVGFLAGSYLDAYTRQRELVGTWIQLQRKNTTPLAEKLYSTVINVAPTTEAGQIAKTWMEDNAAILPILPPPPPQQLPIPSSRQPGGIPRRAGSGYYDVTAPQPSSSSSSSSLPLPIHRPGSGFYDSSRNNSNTSSSTSPVSSSISPTQNTVQEAKETVEEPVRRAPILRHERHLRRPRILDPTEEQSIDSEQSLQNKIQSGGNRYGDE